ESQVKLAFRQLAAAWEPNAQVICEGLAVDRRSTILNRRSTSLTAGRALMLPTFYFYV
ncbi:hypothetical protein HAX54_007711, partial [Datura stramonium]|nr:hypothetical protein [Datura stramonium]